MTTSVLLKRDQVPQELTWDLESVYKTDADWETDFAKIAPLLDEIKGYSGRMTKSAKRLFEALSLRDTINRLGEKLLVYATMRLHQDTTNPVYQGLAGRADLLVNQISTAVSFIEPEILATPPTRLRAMLPKNKGLKVYEFELDKLERQREHVLGSEMEELLAQAGDVAQAPDNIFSMINDADLKLPTILMPDSTQAQLSKGNYGSVFLESPDRNLRRQAFEGMHGTYNDLRNTLARCYAGQVKKDIFYSRARKYESCLHAALEPINVPISVYDNLTSTVNANLPHLHRYLELRRKALGLEDLRIYDLYVPMVKDVKYQITYPNAQKLALEALAPLGSDYTDALRAGFAARWTDVAENEGKRSGAYSWGSYDTSPFMLLNWHDSMNWLFTLIHEAGHSMHSYHTRKAQPYIYGGYTLFVAEVASICNEMLLTHHLLATETDPALRMYIINHALDGFRGTLYRQTLFAEFEKEAHAQAEAGETLTPEYLCGLYKGLNQRYYGAVCTLDDLIEIEWARIPHFYTSFYVYQYATGISAAVALSQQIIKEGAPAVKRYLQFLSSGSSRYSLDLLRDAGVDLSTPAPIQQALDVFANYVTEFERLSTPAAATPAPAKAP